MACISGDRKILPCNTRRPSGDIVGRRWLWLPKSELLADKLLCLIASSPALRIARFESIKPQELFVQVWIFGLSICEELGHVEAIG
jgi:hypothetical protein